MHPNPDFRAKPPELAEYFVREIGFAALFAATPDGPRVAHTPILLNEAATHIRFHLARGNALTRHLAGLPCLAVIHGPDAYVSAHDYAATGQVPTWNYVAIELEGTATALDDDGLHQFLTDLAAQQDTRIGQSQPWTADSMERRTYDQLFRAISGFEMRITAWRPTFKLSQNKPDADHAAVASALEQRGHGAVAQLMRHLPSLREKA
jgi:transcriptional regulator